MARLTWLAIPALLASMLLGGCAKLGRDSVANEGIRAVTSQQSATSYPSALTMTRGQTSTQALSVLAKKDQSGTQDTWGRYRDFTPSATGLLADFIFPAPTGMSATSVLNVQLNYMGWERARQRWQFSLLDTRQNQWVYLGDNAAAKSWSWTLLTFSTPGQLGDYLENGLVTLRYSTDSNLENSHIDFAALTATGSIGALPTPTPTPRGVPATPVPTATPPPTTGALPGTGRIPAGRMHGVTLDSVADVSGTLASLTAMSRRPTVRIVFDEGVSASDYRNAATSIYNAGYIMGELLDSFAMKSISVAQYQARTTEYLNVLGDKVDIWEVGNEINGEWLGATADTVAKMTAAYDLVRARNGVTELTLYYNENCWATPANEMFTWAQANVPARMKQGLDYVLVSYYEDDCNDLQPDWFTAFHRLAEMFPNSRIGFGETGTKYANRKVAYINRYYAMELGEPHFIGGFFWWYGRQDFVPPTSSYFNAFNAMISLH